MLRVLFLKLINERSLTCDKISSPLDWLEEQAATSEMCYFLNLLMKFQVNILLFVRSLREGNFKLYTEILRKMAPWCFSLDHNNYFRSLCMHVFDLLTLEKVHPDIYPDIAAGKFSFQKTSNQFSMMGIDQIHEQNNKVIKSGSAINLLNRESESALVRWEICGPEIGRIVGEFENIRSNSLLQSEHGTHHEDNTAFHNCFSKDVKTLYSAICGNPFLLDKLVRMNDFDKPAPSGLILELKALYSLGEDHFCRFIVDRLILSKIPIS